MIAASIAQASPLAVEIHLTAPWHDLPSLPFAQVAVFAPPAFLEALPDDVSRIADLTPYDGRLPEPPAPGEAAAAAFLLSATTAPLLPEAAASAALAGVATMILPPLPFQLLGRLGGPLSSPGNLSSLWRTVLLPAIERLRGLRWEIHDRFLVERFQEAGLDVGAPPSDAGCQAGTALAFVGPGGEVFPCPIWPVPFGRLYSGWDEVWQGEARRRFLEEFPRHGACDGCPRWGGCFGGCPGASAALGLAGIPDPLCPEVGRD
jgi:radical SAM protein with 4Fe4S-binding SPASM domain